MILTLLECGKVRCYTILHGIACLISTNSHGLNIDSLHDYGHLPQEQSGSPKCLFFLQQNCSASSTPPSVLLTLGRSTTRVYYSKCPVLTTTLQPVYTYGFHRLDPEFPSPYGHLHEKWWRTKPDFDLSLGEELSNLDNSFTFLFLWYDG